jgi:hypothetical protein
MPKPSKRQAAALIRNRIVGHGEEPPDQLLANPFNARRHSGAQLEALRGSLSELGWVRTILVNKTTGHVVDGHARIEEAMRQGGEPVPITYVELTEAEEKLALAVLDPMAEMATIDEAALEALLAEVETDNPALQEMLDGLEGSPEKHKPIEVKEVDFSDVEDRFWLSVRGPLAQQMAALEKLRAALEELPGVEVDVGTIE